jgi:hypothetical protein
MKSRILNFVFAVSFILSCNSVLSQHNWVVGEIAIESEVYCVERTYSGTILIQRKSKGNKSELKLGVDPDKGMTSVTINSERSFFNAINKAFNYTKLKEMASLNHSLRIGITIDENGIPFQVYFSFHEKSIITPEELIFIEQEILNNVRYTIRRQQPFDEPCVYFAGATIKFQDILNGEIPGLKRSEQHGKEKPEWER